MKASTMALSALALFLSASSPTAASAAPVKDDVALKRALEDEMARAVGKLRLGAEPAPYFVGYTIVDEDRARISARLGALVLEERSPIRTLRVDLRVGSPDEDNTNFRGESGRASVGVSTDDDYTAVRRDLWEVTDHEYKRALETLARKKASKSIESADKDAVPDFAKAPPTQSVSDHAVVPTDAARASMKALTLELSALFLQFPTVQSARADGTTQLVRRRMLTSEKTWVDERWSRLRIDVEAETTTPDGQRLAAALAFTAPDIQTLVSMHDKMKSEVQALAKNLAEQRTAPAVEAGAASVLFERRAAAQLARLLLAGPLVGHPEPRSAGSGPRDGSSSLADKLGQKVAPSWLTVVDDPTALGPGKVRLYGAYVTDDEGVPAERLKLLDHGVVKTLFMSRAPRKEITRSNGHGRAMGRGIRAAASNLFVTADNGVSRAELLADATRSAGPKGTVYVVRELDGSSGIGRGQTIQARVAFRYKDGKEEPVRGLSLEGFVPKKMKKDLIAAGKELHVLEDETFGAPMAIVTPSLLFEDVDVGKPNDKSRTPPLYKSPLEAKP